MIRACFQLSLTNTDVWVSAEKYTELTFTWFLVKNTLIHLAHTAQLVLQQVTVSAKYQEICSKLLRIHLGKKKKNHVPDFSVFNKHCICIYFNC